MSNKTRKRIWPGALVLSIAIVGVLAAFLVLANNPGYIMAHGDSEITGSCDELDGITRELHDLQHTLASTDPCPADTAPMPSVTVTGTPAPGEPQMVDGTTAGDPPVKVKSTTASGSDDITINIAELGMPMPPGSSVVLYLRDEFALPDSIRG